MARRFPRRAVVATAAAAVSVLALAACGGGDTPAASAGGDLKGKTLIVNTAGGSLGKFHDDYIIKPFEQKYGVKVRTVEGLSQDILAKVRAAQGEPPLDVVFASNSALAQGAKQNLWEKLDEASVPALKSMDPKYRFDGDMFASTYNGPVVLVYNKDKIKTPPTSWKDLWNPAYKKHVIIPDFNGCCGVLLLLQTAVDNGGSVQNADPGFAKLKELKPNLLTLFTSNTQAQTLYTSGEAWIGAWSIDRVVDQIKKGANLGYVFPQEGSPMVLNSIAVVKNTKEPDLARKFVDFALEAVAKPEFFTLLASVPGRDVAVPEESKKYYPTAEDLQKSMVVDWSKAIDQMDDWTARWQREVASR